MKEVVGICIGASTVSFVLVKQEPTSQIAIIDAQSISHNGFPRKIIEENLEKYISPEREFVVTGRKLRNLTKIASISEPEAIEYAFEHLRGASREYSAIASLGGETFLVYTLDSNGKIENIVTRNQCASGTGEFFLQQIKRMNISLEEATNYALATKPYKVSGRCSVFCKSDCTHALNKGVPKHEVINGLAEMMADKAEELLKKVRPGKILVVGGVTKIDLVMNYLKQKVKEVEIPKEATYFEALGSAIYGLKKGGSKIRNIEQIFDEKHSSFVFHPPLSKFKDKVTFKEFKKSPYNPEDMYILGLDVGSTTTKAILINEKDNSIVASVYLYTYGDPITASKKCYKSLLEQTSEDIKIIGLGVTGSGRHISALHALSEGVVNEIIAHATASLYFDSEVDTIFEIGGQDAKYTYIVNKVPADYAMNEACSAGTGSFIEESAWESLGIPVTEIEQIAFRGKNPPNFSDQCSAFISSDIKTALHENLSREDIVAGLVYSICLNYVNRVKGSRQVGKKVFMQGGVCYNKAVPVAMASLIGKEIIVPPEPGLMGAFGVALEIKERLKLGILKEKLFNLKELSEREVIYHKPFICPGGTEKCDLKCSINVIEVQGKKYPFGGACNKYYSITKTANVKTEKYDYVKKRNHLIFNKYITDREIPQNAHSIGINLSFQTHSLYPLFYNFFTKLGFRVILPDKIDEAGFEREHTSFCYPGQLSLALFQDLVKKNPDYYFVPNILEMNVDEGEYQRLDFNCTCVFVSGEPYYIRQAFKDYNLGDKLLTPSLNFANGYLSQIDAFIEIGKKLGVGPSQSEEAFLYAVKIMEQCNQDLLELGKEALKEIEANPENIGIVLLGRPYNSFTELANKGIPQKFASRGVYVLPFDILNYKNETLEEPHYWESGKKILKASKVIARHNQLFATYITNFSCGPDSLIITLFRNIMQSKPSLTLELDGHTADAGINTRIDAALDIIKNYRKIYTISQNTEEKDYTPAKIEVGNNEGIYITSDGEKLPLTDPNIVILIPSMGDLSARMFAAGLRSQGFNAEALPEGNFTILKYGRSVATGKECLPLLLCVGSLLDYIENRWDGKKHIAFFIVQGAGNCRLGQYPVFIRDVIQKKKLRNVATLVLMNEDGFAGIGPKFAVRGILTILLSDVLDDIRTAIMANAINPKAGLEIFEQEFEKLCKVIEKTPNKIYKALKKFSQTIRNSIPAKTKIEDSKFIALVGEIYVRRDHFSHKWLNKQLAKKGFILSSGYISEWIFYVDYLIKIGLLEPEKSLAKKIERYTRVAFMRYAEYRVKKILAKSGYYKFSLVNIKKLLNHSKHIIPLEFKGEPGLTLGTALGEIIDKYCGVINLGPFGCMPTRFAEAVSNCEMNVGSKLYAKKLNDKNYKLPKNLKEETPLPFLTIESDGNVYPQVIEAKLETFLLQAERTYNLMREIRLNGKAIETKASTQANRYQEK